jgi:hypothetical protein
MGIETTIIDGNTGKAGKVLSEGEVFTSQSGCPPMLPQKCKAFSQKFTTDGLPGGDDDMGVNGSVTAVEYYIGASNDNDRYITRISFVLGYGASAEGFEFADSGAALTNGVKVAYIDSQGTEVTVINPKANYEFMRDSDAPISRVGWQARGFAATGDYGYFVNINLSQIMPPHGVKLDKGSNQKMVVTIRDDCTDADLFNCQSFGFERFE